MVFVVVILGVALFASIAFNAKLYVDRDSLRFALKCAENDRDQLQRELEALRNAETIPAPFEPRDTLPGANCIAERSSTMRPPRMPSDVSDLKRTIRGFSSYPPKAG